MKTKAEEHLPEIEWYDLKAELLESDPEEREKIYSACGIDSNGTQYIGSAVFVCDELQCVRDIEKLTTSKY